MNKTLIIISAPIGAGKTVLTERLSHYYSFEEAQCKEKLHEMTRVFFNVSEELYWATYNNRKMKESPAKEFAVTFAYAEKLAIGLNKPEIITHQERRLYKDMVKLSLREAMIFVSEFICKPVFGHTYFGECRATKVEGSDNKLFVDDSAFGTFDEVEATYNLLGADNILVMRVYGRGDFNGDSRKYLEDNRLTNYVDLFNNGDIEDYLQQGISVAEDFLGERGIYIQNDLEDLK